MDPHGAGGLLLFLKSSGICPPPMPLCRYEVGGDGAVTLTRAFGRALAGRRRYDLDFGTHRKRPGDLHPVCGNFLEEAVLPDGLQVIGSCAFYNCRKLRRLSCRGRRPDRGQRCLP